MKRNNFLKTLAASTGGVIAIPQSFYTKVSTFLGPLKPKIVRAEEGKTINVLGDMQTIKLRGNDTNGLFTLIEEENAPGTTIPMHVHDNEDEVFKVLEGEMELTVGGKTTILKAGDLGFGPRGIPHTWKIVGTQKAKVILSVFPSGIETMFEELADLPSGPPDFEQVAKICENHGIRFV